MISHEDRDGSVGVTATATLQAVDDGTHAPDEHVKSAAALVNALELVRGLPDFLSEFPSPWYATSRKGSDRKLSSKPYCFAMKLSQQISFELVKALAACTSRDPTLVGTLRAMEQLVLLMPFLREGRPIEQYCIVDMKLKAVGALANVGFPDIHVWHDARLKYQQQRQERQSAAPAMTTAATTAVITATTSASATITATKIDVATTYPPHLSLIVPRRLPLSSSCGNSPLRLIVCIRGGGSTSSSLNLKQGYVFVSPSFVSKTRECKSGLTRCGDDDMLSSTTVYWNFPVITKDKMDIVKFVSDACSSSTILSLSPPPQVPTIGATTATAPTTTTTTTSRSFAMPRLELSKVGVGAGSGSGSGSGLMVPVMAPTLTLSLTKVDGTPGKDGRKKTSASSSATPVFLMKSFGPGSGSRPACPPVFSGSISAKKDVKHVQANVFALAPAPAPAPAPASAPAPAPAPASASSTATRQVGSKYVCAAPMDSVYHLDDDMRKRQRMSMGDDDDRDF